MMEQTSVRDRLDVRRIFLFLAFAYGLAWAIALVIYLTGGLAASPVLIPAAKITLAVVLLPVYMWMPAIAHFLTRRLTDEGRRDLYLRPRFRAAWPYWLAAWLLPIAFTVTGAAVYFALFPEQFDLSFTVIRAQVEAAEQQGAPVPLPLESIVILQVLTGIFLSPFINAPFTFGEEFGWRAYLQPKLLPLGWRPAMLWMGLIWGVWHWPIIAMGHNYGTGYAGYPWLGLLLMVWFTFIVGTFLGWVALQGGSVWPAVIGHAVINGVGGFGLLFLGTQPNLLLGPPPTGLIGSVVWSLAALLLLWRLGPPAHRELEAETHATTPTPG